MLRTLALLPKRGVALLVAALILPCVLMASSTLLALRSERSMHLANRWVQHTGEVMALLQSFDAAAAELGMGVRGFLLARRPADEQAASAAARRMRGAVASLRALTADNPLQQANLHELATATARRTEIVVQAISLEQTGRHADAQALILSAENESLLAVMHATCTRMMEEEQARLAERQERVLEITHRRTLYSWFMLGANALALLSLLFLLYWLRKLQGLVRICAWSRTVEYQGEWLSFEKYLQARFGLNTSHGISPEEAAKVFDSVTRATIAAPK